MSLRRQVFIEKAKKIHGGKYDYSNIIVDHDTIFVDLKCNSCERVFRTRIRSHLANKTGCRYCNCKKTIDKRNNAINFVELAHQVHGDLYDYSNTKYSRKNDKLEIYCKNCNKTFVKTYQDHITNKVGCKCQRTKKKYVKKNLTTEDFIEMSKQIHGENTFDYSKTIYINSAKKFTFLCKSCGYKMEQTFHVHMKFKGCTRCMRTIRISKQTTENWIKCAKSSCSHDLDYSKVVYTNSTTKITLGCRKHGDFEMYPYNFFAINIHCHQCRLEYHSKRH
ncbi:oxidoreductase (C-term) [Cotonvirus japonicus]|uniref:Oxidoreductase (C-term) n=1 Tax=Cotonvirus japonicus TaxID=2811091 RepID=A0ABM7NRT0_9VIRU|nr:oxidoreductase (C-term) [Cotonvirus japonicus]BCS82806.1 oxidoreductase (C-term) [Cotonvirus japonicus]